MSQKHHQYVPENQESLLEVFGKRDYLLINFLTTKMRVTEKMTMILI